MGWQRLTVGGFTIGYVGQELPSELLAIFQDRMYRRRPFDGAVDHGYLTPRVRKGKCGCGRKHPQYVHELVGQGKDVADRLDALGISPATTAIEIERWITQINNDPVVDNEYPHLKNLTVKQWIEQVQIALTGEDLFPLLPLTADEPLADCRFVIRAMLMADVNQNVELDLTQMIDALGVASKPELLCADALRQLRETLPQYAPLVVLTEGRSDVEILDPALRILYPHLQGLIHFMDFNSRPPGGVGWLAGLVKSFSSAGIVNRVVALFDNDSAARAAISKIGKMPSNIRILQLPELDLLRAYPTLGPPNTEYPEGYTTKADVNGTAASIELYLGGDVLRDGHGYLQPVQWTAFEKGIKRYQGEVVDKTLLQERYKQKVRAAEADPQIVATQDWTGMRAILEALLRAFN